MVAKTWDVGLPRDFAMVTRACTEAEEGLASCHPLAIIFFIQSAVKPAVLMCHIFNGHQSKGLIDLTNAPSSRRLQAIHRANDVASLLSLTATEPDSLRSWAAPRRGSGDSHLGGGKGRHVVLQPLYLYEVLWAQDVHARGDGLRHLQARESMMHSSPLLPLTDIHTSVLIE